MVSPLCEVKDGAGAYGSTTNGVNVTPANTITIRLISQAGVDSWSITCATTDELSVAATVTASLTIDTLAKTATFTAPVAGRAYRFQSRVNGGVDKNGVAQSTYTTTFGIYTLTGGGLRVHAVDETLEGGSFGWCADINALIRSGGSSFTAGGDLSGTSSSQTVEKVKGTTITTAGGALAVGAVLRTTAVGTADWGTLDLADADARTGVLPLANQAAPTGTGLVTTTSGAWDAASTANVSYSGGGLVLNSSGFLSWNTTPATTGVIRGPNATTVIAAVRNAGNTNNLHLVGSDSSNLYLGTDPSFTAANQVSGVKIYCVGGGTIAIGDGGTTQVYLDGTDAHIAKPLAGYGDATIPFRLKSATITFASANYTLSAAEYQCPYLTLTGTTAGARDLVGPDTTNATFNILNSTADIITLKKSGGAGIAIVAGAKGWFRHNGTDYEAR